MFIIFICRHINPSESNIASKKLGDKSNEMNLRKLHINAQVTAMTTLIETLGDITFFIHLHYNKSSLQIFLHSIIKRFLIMPYTFLMNTSHNKDRILENGWINVLRNMVVRTSSVKLRTSNKPVDIKETNTQGKTSKGVVYQQEAIKYKVQNSKDNQFSTTINDDSIFIKTSHTTRHFYEMPSKSSIPKDKRISFLDIEELEKRELIKASYFRLADDMLKCLEIESEYNKSFTKLLRMVDCHRNRDNSLIYDVELELSNECLPNKETVKGHLTLKRRRSRILIAQDSIDNNTNENIDNADEKKKSSRRERRRDLINELISHIDDQNEKGFDYFLNLLIDLEENFGDEN